MAKVPTKNFTIAAGGTPQPLIGTTTTVAITLSPLVQSIAVADSTPFKISEDVWVDTFAKAEKVEIIDIPDGTHIKAIFAKTHASGVAVALSGVATAVYAQAQDGNAGALFIFYSPGQFGPAPAYGRGSLTMAKTGKVLCLAELKAVVAAAQPQEFSTANNFGANPDRIEYYWIDGTTGDSYVPSFEVV